MTSLSALRSKLCRFEHAYACAVQLRKATGRNQFVVRTGNPLQPFRVSETMPADDEHLLVRVA